jgi:hypothetical protein
MSRTGDSWDRGRSLRRRRGVISWTALLLLCGAMAGCADVPRGTPSLDARALEDTLRRRVEQAYDFSQPGVVERMTSLYPASGVVSASGGQLVTSADSLRQGIADFWENVGRNMEDPVWRWGDVYVAPLAPDAAVLTATWSIPHIAPTGRPHVIAGAWTAVFRRIDGAWYIVHEHLSTPSAQ